MYNLILILIIIVCSLTYLFYIYFEYGVQSSISASYNNLKPGITKSFYSLFILFIALPMAIVSDNGMGYLAGGFLMLDFIYTAAKTNTKEADLFHVIGAQGGMYLGVAMLGFIYSQWWLVILIVITVLATWVLKKKEIKIGTWQMINETWWIECEVLAGVIVGLIIEKF